MHIRTLYVLRLSLGGAIWGCLLGIVCGALAGVVYGALTGDITLGLDGAVLGCFALAIVGGLYGLALGFRVRHHRQAPERAHPPRWEDAAPGVAKTLRV